MLATATMWIILGRPVAAVEHSKPARESGRLRDLRVPELLWQLHAARRTGCLKVQHGEAVIKQLWLKDGEPVFARSNQPADRLTDRMLARGLLSRLQYDAAQQLQANRGILGKRIGELLIEAGLVTAVDLNEALREHLLRMLDAMFLWEDGRWEFEPGVTTAEPVTLDVPTEAILMGGARHRIPRSRLWEVIGDREQRPRLAPEDRSESGREALARLLRLEPNEASWLPQLDGSRSLQAMLSDFDADEHELVSLVYTLRMIDRVELLQPEPRPFRR
jgi:hypothetical protein